MSNQSIANAAQDIGVITIGGWAIWLLGLVEGEVAGIDLGLILRILLGSILVIGLVWINLVSPKLQCARARREAEVYAETFRDQIRTDAKRIDAMFNIR